jgi:hypothetical protein
MMSALCIHSRLNRWLMIKEMKEVIIRGAVVVAVIVASVTNLPSTL